MKQHPAALLAAHGPGLRRCDLYTLDAALPDIEWYVVVRASDALISQCKSADKVDVKVAAVGGDTDQQPFTEVLARIVQ